MYRRVHPQDGTNLMNYFLTTMKKGQEIQGDDENARTISAGISTRVPSRANVPWMGLREWKTRIEHRREFSFSTWEHFVNVTLNGRVEEIFEREFSFVREKREKRGVVCNEMRFNSLTLYFWSCSIDVFCQIIFLNTETNSSTIVIFPGFCLTWDTLSTVKWILDKETSKILIIIIKN